VILVWDAGTGAGLLAGARTTSPLVGIRTDVLRQVADRNLAMAVERLLGHGSA
jgi:uncharacterized transporter YbjL